MRYKIAKYISILIIISLFTSGISASTFEKDSGIYRITTQDIFGNKYFNELTIFQSAEEINNYLYSLNTREFLICLAQTCRELELLNSTNELSLFNEVASETLMNQMSAKDYIEILENPDIPANMKVYMIQLYCYKQQLNNCSNEAIMNNKLRVIIKNQTTTDTMLKLEALDSIDDFDKNSIPLLLDIFDSAQTTDSVFKCKILHKLNRIDSSSISDEIYDILNNFSTHDLNEIATATKLLVRNNGDLGYIEHIISKTESLDILQMCICALGESNDYRSVEIVLNNIYKFKDISMIDYFIDKNYSTIVKMLSPTNEDDTIRLALSCVEICPFKDFVKELIPLKKHENSNIADKAKLLISEINALQNSGNSKSMVANNESIGQRNTKWDE